MVFDKLVSTATLHEHLGDPGWVLVDCRFSLTEPDAGRQAYAQGHIPGARYAHLDRDLAGPVRSDSGRHPLPDRAGFAARLEAWGISRSSQVVVYDDAGGAIAARVWWLLRWLGHEAVALLDGGLDQWLARGGGLTTIAPDARPAHFVSAADDSAWVGTAQLCRALEQRKVTLVDARAEERFRGDHEPIDPVAGHVPGAFSRPYQLNLASDKCFLPPQQLRAQFEQLLNGAQPSTVVHMCGSGVTACHNLLAMELAGLGGSRLYPGSWSEWIRDPARSVVTGPEPGERP